MLPLFRLRRNSPRGTTKPGRKITEAGIDFSTGAGYVKDAVQPRGDDCQTWKVLLAELVALPYLCPFHLLPDVNENNIINIIVAVVLLFAVGLTPNAYETVAGRVEGIAEVINGVYQSRQLENQIAAKEWRDLKSRFSSSLNKKLTSYNQLKRGFLLTDNLFPLYTPGTALNEDIAYGSDYKAKPLIRFANPASIQSTYGLGTIVAHIPTPEHRYENVAIRFKIKADPVRYNQGERRSDLTFAFWPQSENDYTAYIFMNESGINRVRYINSFRSNVKDQYISINESPDNEGYLDIEILGVEYDCTLFVNGKEVRQTSSSRELGGPVAAGYGYISFYIDGLNNKYWIKDFTIAALYES